MAQRWRLIESGPGEPAWNMAVDEALMISHCEDDCMPALRLYTWSPPALSLGYFQKTAGIRFDILEKHGIVPVRRLTGGRAVLHYGDLTYSVVARVGKDTPQSLAASYRYLCSGLLAAFSSLGLEARMGNENTGSDMPASCFAVATPGDITWQGKKFVGSAQKRLGTTLLQHGSILLRSQENILSEILDGDERTDTQSLSEKVTCLDDILRRQVELAAVSAALISGFKTAMNVELQPGRLSGEEEALAASLKNKYSASCKSHEKSQSPCRII